ncbi:hypothetical protein [Nocardia sp. CA-135398]|uniref:hypothetical protein n=1 Tax=Nocardia sp. CA-135398 TaxID=3239977 RepID=UPI003D952FB1
MTRIDPQNFTTLLDTIAQRRSAGDETVSAESSTRILAPEVRAANIPQEVKDAVQPAETGMLNQLVHTGATASEDAQRVLAGAIDADAFGDRISQLMDSAITQFGQLQDSTTAKLRALGNQHPDWQQTIISVFQAVNNLLLNALDTECDFLTLLVSDTPHQAGRVNTFFGDLVSRIEDGWSQIVG